MRAICLNDIVYKNGFLNWYFFKQSPYKSLCPTIDTIYSIKATVLKKTKILVIGCSLQDDGSPYLKLFSINESTLLELLKSVFINLDLLHVGLKVKYNSKKCKGYNCFGCETMHGIS